MDYKPPDNIYWLFSSSAQAIAAFIGFLAAGFFFTYERLDRQVEKDETLEEIFADIKSQYFKRLRVLFILTGLSIFFSLLCVYLNGFDLCIFGSFFYITVGLLNTLTIGWAISFVILIIDPNKIQHTTEKLIKESKDIFEPGGGQSLTRGAFIEKFIKLEGLIRSLASKNKVVADDHGKHKPFLSIGEIIRILYQRELISQRQMINLLEVNKVRNLAAHGEIQNIEEKLGSQVDELIKQIEQLDKK